MTELSESSFTATEEEPPEQKETVVKIRFSVFFDGTLNNRTNTDAREGNTKAFQTNSDSGSYHNDLSNVAKMEGYVDKAAGFDVSLKLYVEGAGTTDEEGDSTVGYALGKGTTGVKAKVDTGMANVNGAIREEVDSEATIESLVFDVFGFSRGAAAARYFIHQLLSDEPIRRGRSTQAARPIYERLKAAGFKIEANQVTVRFVGLYDTVASEGVIHSNDTYSLKLDSVGRQEVEQVIHLVSADEHRANFSLTNINSAGGKGKQIFLPGAHSDIGGGYRDNTDESLRLNKSYSTDYLEFDRRQLIQWGYYREDEIAVEEPSRVTSPRHRQHQRPGSLVANREAIRHHYDRIPLHIMADFARKAGMTLRSQIDVEEIVPTALSSEFTDLKSYASGSGASPDQWLSECPYSWLPKLRHDYMHFSAHLTKSALVLTPHKPNLVDGLRERIQHDG